MSAASSQLISSQLISSHVMSARELALRQSEHGLFPVVEPLATVLPRGALQRSLVYQCAGSASFSAMWALVAAATQHGSWLCLVDMPHAGLVAAREYGVALERVVQVNTGSSTTASSTTASSTTASSKTGKSSSVWLRTVGALVDGIDIVVINRPRCQPSEARKISARVKSQSGVLIVIDPPDHFSPDIVVRTTQSHWMIDGHARERRVSIVLEGRRAHHARPVSLLLPSSSGRAALPC